MLKKTQGVSLSLGDGKDMSVGIISVLLPFRDCTIAFLKILLEKTDMAMAWQLLGFCFRQGRSC